MGSEMCIRDRGKRVNNRGFDSFITRMHEVCAQLILGKKLNEINAQPKIINKKDLIFFKNPPKNWTTLDTYFYYISIKNNFQIFEIDVIFKSRLYTHGVVEEPIGSRACLERVSSM